MLSIIIPVYNEKRTVEKVIDKIMSLNYIEKEIVVVDDASKDGSIQVLENIKSNETLYILPTYSAMLDLRKILTGKAIL